jgi:hypothetical protein
MTNPGRFRRYCAALSVLVIAGCDLLDSSETICTSNFVFGLVVAVQDSSTGAPAASGAQLIVQEGAWADTVGFPTNRPDLDAQPLVSAGERPGTYAVAVRKAGFRDWERAGVVVTADECHVHPVELTARLQPAP